MTTGKLPQGMFQDAVHLRAFQGNNTFYQLTGTIFAIIEKPGDYPAIIRWKLDVFPLDLNMNRGVYYGDLYIQYTKYQNKYLTETANK